MTDVEETITNDREWNNRATCVWITFCTIHQEKKHAGRCESDRVRPTKAFCMNTAVNGAAWCAVYRVKKMHERSSSNGNEQRIQWMRGGPSLALYELMRTRQSSPLGRGEGDRRHKMTSICQQRWSQQLAGPALSRNASLQHSSRIPPCVLTEFRDCLQS